MGERCFSNNGQSHLSPITVVMKLTSKRTSRSDKVLRILSAIGLLQLFFAPAGLAQGNGAQTPADYAGKMLIAQEAVSTTTVPKQQSIPQVLPPLPQPETTTPSTSPRIPSLDQLDQMFKQSSLGKEADEARLHQQWREVSNHVVNDPDLVAARASVGTAKTDLIKRQRLRAYYKMYYDRMKAKAASPELKNYIDARKADHLAATAQPKVRPEASATPARR